MDFKLYGRIFGLDLCTAMMISLILLLVTYSLEGSAGILSLIEGYIAQSHNAHLISIMIIGVLGLILWMFRYFFNFKIKMQLGLLSDRFIDLFASLIRLMGGALISFSLFYILFQSYHPVLKSYFLLGGLLLLESGIFSIWAHKLKHRNERRIIPPFSMS
ncbi:hypothetical protein EC844_11193 [Acinetobacter calcoaceticus]|uniref:Uncharacterized protein n=1 Tax=Acinetobacter calcoaceticus TaxID=471 RepID=A0A4R1Y410_ACICA|nr:hypothetical protein EC844_11193 [Acinetobacter calcoaceticus]